MIDVHSHIVFDVDDGPETLEESLDLIGESYAQGVLPSTTNCSV